MTDAKPSTLSDRQLAAVMRASPVGMTIVDNDGRLVEVNRAMCELTGRSEAELRGMSWRDLTHRDDQHVGTAEIEELFAGTRDSFAVEKRYARPDGEVRWVMVSVSLVRDALGAPSHRITQHVDITDRKQWESELQRNAAVQARALNALRDLENAKSSFLTAVSHELRTPLTVIHGLAETLAHLPAGTTPDVRPRLEQILLRNTRRMATLVDDLLDLERLLAGELTLDPTRLDLAAHVRDLVAGSVLHGRTTVEAPERLWVSTDRSRVTLIVNHLLDNVTKYAPEGAVTVTLSPLDGGGARLEVADEGPGIPPDQRDAVFRPFHRLADDHPKPGTGIGLALVARFADWHGGGASILDSSAGTHVVVLLPDLPSVAPTARSSAVRTADVAGMASQDRRPSADVHAPPASDRLGRILVVDDDPQVRAMFRSALVYAGHEVTEADSAEAARVVLTEETFDLALLDMDLAGSSGSGIASLIRADDRHAATSVVFVSGDSSIETKLAGLDAGGSDYLAKPVSLRELLARVDAHLRDHAAWTGRQGGSPIGPEDEG